MAAKTTAKTVYLTLLTLFCIFGCSLFFFTQVLLAQILLPQNAFAAASSPLTSAEHQAEAQLSEAPLLEAQPSKVQLKGLVVFGDSLTDNVNTWRLSHYYTGLPDPLDESYNTNSFQTIFSGLLPFIVTYIGPFLVPFPIFPAPPYQRGFFTNGPTATEYLAGYAGLDRHDRSQYRNLAYGASWSTTVDDALAHAWEQKRLPSLRLMFQGKVLPPNLPRVVDGFLHDTPQLDADVMYAVNFSGNDYLNGFSSPAVVASRQYDNIRKLINAGARHIFWGLVPDYSIAPCFHKGPRRDVVTNWGKEHNRLVRKLATLIQRAWPDVRLTLTDIGSIFHDVAYDPANGFTDLHQPCTNVYIPGCDHTPGMVTIFNTRQATVCDKPDNILFWDQVHASAKAQLLASGYVCRVLAENGYLLNCPDMDELRQKTMSAPQEPEHCHCLPPSSDNVSIVLSQPGA